ncbi:MAG: hypothetical protein M1380_09785 [Chloroflexi bacterium]|nr:hypothetical protein [Chloroflexota bacterium]
MSLTQRVVEWTGSIGADLVAAVPVVELEGVTRGYRPEELVPGARSVVVIALKMVDAIWDRLQGKKDFFSDVLRNYLASYNYPQLDHLAIRTARFLEDEGYAAFPVDGPSAGRVRHLDADSEERATPLQTALLSQGKGIWDTPFAFKPIAAAAGLGVIGKNSLVISPEYGPRVRFVCVVTDAELERTRAAAVGNPGEICGSCHLCIDSCPVGALSFDEQTSRPSIDRAACNTYMDYCQCALCQAVCPLGKKHRKKNGSSQAIATDAVDPLA